MQYLNTVLIRTSISQCQTNATVSLILFSRNALVTQMQKSPFSLATDGSNDNALLKMNPLTVRVFYVNLGKVKTCLLDMCMSKGGTAEELFSSIDNMHVVIWNFLE